MGTAAIDHVALTAVGYADFVARFRAAGLDWREFLVTGTTLYQLFLYDPSGVMLEITLDGRAEPSVTPDMPDGRRYVAGKDFFRPARSLTRCGAQCHGQPQVANWCCCDTTERQSEGVRPLLTTRSTTWRL